ncbi:hypothetical protein [Clostridium butyricum]|uniref:hypothetical protein n=1 Tax=Clostridium butyricum TaxID=1492 RepID=UPI0022E2293F|nr:hypothetical protein [Clostridium butyricum]
MKKIKISLIICVAITTIITTTKVKITSAEELNFDSLRNIVTNQSIPENSIISNTECGWIKDGTEWKYFSSGIAQIGWQYISPNWYYFYDNGIMAHDTVVNNKYKINSDGVWVR